MKPYQRAWPKYYNSFADAIAEQFAHPGNLTSCDNCGRTGHIDYFDYNGRMTVCDHCSYDDQIEAFDDLIDS